MKQDLLRAFREYLNTIYDNPKTADRYYFTAKKLFDGVLINDFSEIEPEFLESRMSECRTRKEFSLAKVTIGHLAGFSGGRLTSPPSAAEPAPMRRSTTRPGETVDAERMRRKINALRDNKLKYAYRLMTASGLRVSEAASLTRRDIIINDGKITLKVQRGKGGKSGEVECLPDSYLAERLPDFLDGIGDDDKPFYPAQTMKNRAGELDIECHDMRRIAAMTYRKSLLDGGTEYNDANEQTQDFLRHSRFSTTKRYVFNKKRRFKGIKSINKVL